MTTQFACILVAIKYLAKQLFYNSTKLHTVEKVNVISSPYIEQHNAKPFDYVIASDDLLV